MRRKSWIRQRGRDEASRWKIRRRHGRDSDGAAGEETPNDNAALEEMLKNWILLKFPEKEEQPEEETTAEESRIEETPIGEAVPERIWTVYFRTI